MYKIQTLVYLRLNIVEPTPIQKVEEDKYCPVLNCYTVVTYGPFFLQNLCETDKLLKWILTGV